MKIKFKKGDSVLVPIGTEIKFFSGSILDKNPFKTGKMEYNLIGKIVSLNKENAAIEPWHHNGSGNCGLINLNPKKLKTTRFILKWDYDKQVQRVYDPDNMPKNGYKEYICAIEFVTMENNNQTYHEWGVNLWAKNRKQALKFLKERKVKRIEKELNKILNNLKFKAKLHWNGNYANAAYV